MLFQEPQLKNAAEVALLEEATGGPDVAARLRSLGWWRGAERVFEPNPTELTSHWKAGMREADLLSQLQRWTMHSR